MPPAVRPSQAPFPDTEQRLLLAGRHHDPFSLLGRHGQSVLAYNPHAEAMLLEGSHRELAMAPLGQGFFQWQGRAKLPDHPRLKWQDGAGRWHSEQDPYSFGPQLPDFDLHLFGEGRHWHIYRLLGAHLHQVDGIEGVLFATWAPNAERVSVIGDFNGWDGRRHPMRARGTSGVWELFIPGLGAGELYKFELRSRHSGEVLQKADPYGNQFEHRPRTAALVAPPQGHVWQDGDWLQKRAKADWLHQPLSIYEVHLGSWRRGPNGRLLGYREAAEQLVAHALALGFTHIELLPITEHPLDESWGYQTTGYYAPTSRFGSPDDFRFLVDHCHRHGLGVILDWVPAHFPKDEHALARFDGTALYEHDDPKRGEHREWGTLVYNYGRKEVRNFLLANANFWLEEFHIDGLRVDAVAAMLYLDYSRQEGEWTPNQYGGNEHLEAVDFLKDLNELTHGLHPGTLTFAEESTAWPQVTRPTWLGGLGFSMKWNMGWMHDSLDYLAKDPVFRHYHHDRLTFGLLYAFTENFVLPFSHDEVVHGKRSLLAKMPGDEWQRFANLRLLYCYLFTYPGAKLLFMGSEFAQESEWWHGAALDWQLLEQPRHGAVMRLVADLNRLYRGQAGLYRHSFEPQGFEWIDCHDAPQSVVSYLRRDGDDQCLVVLNFTPQVRQGYRIGVPQAGRYVELLNSDSRFYGGSDVGNGLGIDSEPRPWMGREHSISLTLPPLAGLVLKRLG
ncbi:1,4-alpha-glucan branching protein GlgB [Gallaecimonas kandeliae]|uniref:1,4-alpha-glucan branching protein GlgB n=1 Tax=Gallaecimonas kandeliae TaxID=3029055 RepID=UPI002647E57B|nr:1,4-alpha-glucan branching protein GlgB [Gallaecimonas kandeliae]WKE64816.1 1,4-alpha-glucan branching protein GlgB [Gallaecimonas kandeliae]